MCYGTSSGTLKQLIHFGPIIASFLIVYITISGFYCLMSIYPPNSNDLASMVNFIVYITWPLIIFYNYLNAIFIGPGFVPLNWRPNDPKDEQYLQYCEECKGFKAPRSHHCRKCGRCVLKMDHHCPWINTCCGHLNHSHFVYFLFYAPVGCIHAMLILGMTIYRIIFRDFHNAHDRLTSSMFKFNFLRLIFCMFALGMSVGVAIAVGILLIVQLKSIYTNQTGIESWIVKKALHRRMYAQLDTFVYPYNLGWRENFREVFVRVSDGLTWTTRSDCDQYTLTREQLSQKEEKREQALKYLVNESYNGACLPLKKGFKTFCCIPCTEEARLVLHVGDELLVTRCQKHWYYGQLTSTHVKKKGWFPRRCVQLHEDEISKKKDD